MGVNSDVAGEDARATRLEEPDGPAVAALLDEAEALETVRAAIEACM